VGMKVKLSLGSKCSDSALLSLVTCLLWFYDMKGLF
jgi:hypothetical protein